MKKKTMRKLIILIVGLFLTTTSVLPTIGSTPPQPYTFNETTITRTTDGVRVSVHTTNDVITIDYSLEAFSMTPVMINDIEHAYITLGKEPNSLIAGAPDLPYVPRSIIIPDTGTMGVKVVATQYTDYKNILVAPSKGNLLRSVNPEDVPYEFGEIYTQNTWYPREIAELREPYHLRDFRGQVVTVYPFQYNPAEATLRFYTDITIEIFLPVTVINAGLGIKQLEWVDSDFKFIYERHFLNYDTTRYEPVSEQGNMLVITYDAFYDAMMPFVNWKNIKGIPTEIVNVSTIGNANAIKTYIADYYNTNGLTFVLLVGDAAQVPPYMYGGSASDPSNTYVVGNDHYPDLFIGRFSAENLDHVMTQVQRSIEYEHDPQPDAEWYQKGVGVASSQGPGDDGEYDYQHIRNIRTQLLAYTYTHVDELYDGSQGGDDAPGNPTPAMVATAVDNGRSIINYCGHGSTTSWGSSGFNNNNVNALVNDNMLPFVHSVACVNGAFPSTTCFAEAWMRATNNGEPTGAIGAFMSTISQSWNPPMEGQDEFNNLLVQSNTDNIKVTLGGLTAHGCMSMNDKYGSAGTSETDYWTLFGDPSLQIRTDIPVAMTVQHPDFIIYGVTEFELDVPDFPGALCAISKDSVLLGNGYADASGHAIIQFFEPITAEDSVDLVVTGYNALPYITTLSVGEPNFPPLKPEKPQGPSSGKPGNTYEFSTSTTDPDGDMIYYMWDWGDETVREWIGPFASGATATASHVWPEEGKFLLRVKAKDTNGKESDWSDPMVVTMPTSTPLFAFLQHHFPYLWRILEIIRQMIL
jgi:hypothetical protein